MGNDHVELPHLLRCKGCGVPNGRNAESCWSCGAGLVAGSRQRASTSTASARSGAVGAAGRERPTDAAASERADAPSSAGRPARSLPATVAIALALAALVALWSPRADRPAQAHAATSAAVEPLHAGAASLLAAPSRRANAAAEPGLRERAVSAPSTAPPLSARQAAWALGLVAEAPTTAASAPAIDDCRDVDRSLGLCASEATAAEQK